MKAGDQFPVPTSPLDRMTKAVRMAAIVVVLIARTLPTPRTNWQTPVCGPPNVVLSIELALSGGESNRTIASTGDVPIIRRLEFVWPPKMLRSSFLARNEFGRICFSPKKCGVAQTIGGTGKIQIVGLQNHNGAGGHGSGVSTFAAIRWRIGPEIPGRLDSKACGQTASPSRRCR